MTRSPKCDQPDDSANENHHCARKFGLTIWPKNIFSKNEAVDAISTKTSQVWNPPLRGNVLVGRKILPCDAPEEMEEEGDNVDVKMVRDNLQGLPEFPFPDGYHLCFYTQGDEEGWVALYATAEPFLTINRELFDQKFHGDVKALEERMIFMVCGDSENRSRDDPPADNHRHRKVGTAVAWYDDKQHTTEWGRLHWVAIHPNFQGKGLSKPLVAATLQRLEQLGHTKAYLLTSLARVAAIKLYMQFGFVPEARNEIEGKAWKRFFEKHGNE